MEKILEDAKGNCTYRVWCGQAVLTIPSHIFRERSWRERLLTRPWQPFKKRDWGANPSSPGPGQAFEVGDYLIMEEDTYRDFREELARQQMYYGSGEVFIPHKPLPQTQESVRATLLATKTG